MNFIQVLQKVEWVNTKKTGKLKCNNIEEDGRK